MRLSELLRKSFDEHPEKRNRHLRIQAQGKWKLSHKKLLILHMSPVLSPVNHKLCNYLLITEESTLYHCFRHFV